MGGVGQRDDFGDLVRADEAVARVQIGDDGDAQTLEGRGGAQRYRMDDERQAVGLDPECVETKRGEKSEKKSEDGTGGRPEAGESQNLILARDSSETALAPYWPA